MTPRKNRKPRRAEPKTKRKQATTAQRAATSWVAPEEDEEDMLTRELMADLAPLDDLLSAAGRRSPMAREALGAIVMDSDDLIDEPEFAEVYIDPLGCLAELGDVMLELDLNPVDFERLSDDEMEEVVAELALRVCTHEATGAVFEALDGLRARLKQSGDRDDLARVALLQSSFDGDSGLDLLAESGLAQGLVLRSLQAGLALAEAIGIPADEAMEEDDAGQDHLRERILALSASDEQRAAEVLARFPGLWDYLQDFAVDMWEEAAFAVFTGELYLGLFTPEELEAGMRWMAASLLDKPVDALTETDLASHLEPGEDGIVRATAGLEECLDGLINPSWCTRLQQHLADLLAADEISASWQPFVLTLRDSLEEPNLFVDARPFLLSAFLGEIRWAGGLEIATA